MRAKFKQQFIAAINLSLLFGLAWGIMFTATTSIPVEGVSVALQTLFIVLTGLQGLFIFIMQCVRSEHARKEWIRWSSSIIGTCRGAEPSKQAAYSSSGTSNTYQQKTSSSVLNTKNSDRFKLFSSISQKYIKGLTGFPEGKETLSTQEEHEFADFFADGETSVKDNVGLIS